MATEVRMPRQGNTVESCVILSWRKRELDPVRQGETLCEVETDKATFEIPSPTDGVLLKVFRKEGDDVPVHEMIAVVGAPGEDISAFQPQASAPTARAPAQPVTPEPSRGVQNEALPSAGPASPRARRAASTKGVNLDAVQGSGPGGRVLEADVLAAASSRAALTPAARAAVTATNGAVPDRGTGIGGRVLAADIGTVPALAEESETQLRGVRKLVAERMRASLATTAQFTVNMSADATLIEGFRKRAKGAKDAGGLSEITVNDMVMFATVRTLASFPDLNAHLTDGVIRRFGRVHLAFAVDTARGLMVPVVRDAQGLALRELAREARRLAKACSDGSVKADELAGGTFTVSNLGALGAESFTPILNVPQVAILGVNAIQPKAVQNGDAVRFVPHLGLSLTVDHQAVDGAPAARFLRALCDRIASFDLLLASS